MSQILKYSGEGQVPSVENQYVWKSMHLVVRLECWCTLKTSPCTHKLKCLDIHILKKSVPNLVVNMLQELELVTTGSCSKKLVPQNYRACLEKSK